MTKSNTHALGRYTLQWEDKIAVYEVTGKKNDVYVQSSTMSAGKWMIRHCFEEFVQQVIETKGGFESKPTSKGWKRIAAA